MPLTIRLITSNQGKAESYQNIFNDLNLDINVKILNADYPEDKSEETTEYVALEGAKWCADKYNKEVLVTDVGLFIPALNGFPGVNTAFTLDRIYNTGLLHLISNQPDRRCNWTLSLGCCKPNQTPQVFTATASGTLAKKERGEQGFGFDPIFIPQNHTKTLGQDIAIRESVSPLRPALAQFVKWFQK